jgi:hypothetical protein
LGAYKIATFLIVHGTFREFAPDTFKNGNGLGGETVIVCPKHYRVIGIGSQHRHLTDGFAQWQGIVLISQQYHALTCHLQSLVHVFLRFYNRVWNLGPGHECIVIEHAQLEAGTQQAKDGFVYLIFRNQSFLYGFIQGRITAATFQICS